MTQAAPVQLAPAEDGDEHGGPEAAEAAPSRSPTASGVAERGALSAGVAWVRLEWQYTFRQVLQQHPPSPSCARLSSRAVSAGNLA